jgi:dihydrofolate reductase
VTADTKLQTDRKPQVVLIVAMAAERVIGKDGQLPWHLSADLKRFKALTMGHPVIMGRKTHDSIGRALPGRRNIVISRNENLAVNGADCVSSLAAALELVEGADQAYVIGGEQIYRLALPLADRIELTKIDTSVQGDAWFPEINEEQWNERQRETHSDAASGLRYDFVTLERIGR